MDNSPATLPKKNYTKLIIVSLVSAIILLVGAVGFLVFGKKDPSVVATNTISPDQISGSLDINGVIPSGSSITLTQKVLGSKDQPVDFVSGLTPNDGDNWHLDDTSPGESYEIQAKLILNGSEIAFSSPISVTAPASGQILTLNVESENGTENAVISGNIIVNGYIPDGSTISIQGRSLGEQEFTTVAQNLPGQPRQFMSYSTATEGVTYDIVGTLYAADGTTIVGTSPTLTITAPAVNETLTINSTAITPSTPTPTPTSPSPTTAQTTQPTSTPATTPTPQSIIAGSINFNGVAPPNSRIVIFQKVYNTSNYQVAVDNITPSNGATWQWGGPQASTWYDLIAILKQRQSDGTDTDISTSAMQSIAAPATNVQFTLNSGFSLNQPSGPISVACGNESGSTWNAQITFGAVSGAQSYWYQIGTSNGGIQVNNSTQNASGNSNLVVNVQMNSGTPYYARYAYSNLANLNAGNSQFSPFSNTQTLQCGS